MELATLKDVQINIEDESSSLSDNEDIETELDIKETTNPNANTELENTNRNASQSVSPSSTEVTCKPSSSEAITESSNEVITLTSSSQHRNRRLIIRPLTEDAVINLTSNCHSSSSSLHDRLERERDGSDVGDFPEDNNSFDNSLDRHNAAFLVGVWNGPPEMNPSLILTVALGVAFLILLGKYIQSLKPVYA